MSIVSLLVASIIGLLMSITSAIVPTEIIQRIFQERPSHQAVTANVSRNWSGYTITNGTFTGVSGTWTVPQVTNTSSDTYGTDATWVGIGGVDTNDLIQAGTQAMVGQNGEVSYEVFYETLPQVSQAIPMKVSAGDFMTVSMSKGAKDVWQISVQNNTRHQNVTVPVSYQSSLSSAEWIEEAPSSIRRVLPLDNFGTVEFSNATAIKDQKRVTLSDAHAEAITMGNEFGQAIAVASVIGNDGQSFKITRQNNTSDTASNEYHIPGIKIRGIPFFMRMHREYR